MGPQIQDRAICLNSVAPIVLAQLRVAVAEENYTGATRIWDQLVNLKSRLTPREQAMGELGDHRALHILLEGLRDKNPFVVEQTEKAMWKYSCSLGGRTLIKSFRTELSF